MEDTFENVHGQVVVTTPSGKQFVVAECDSPYWADAIAVALAFTRTENF